MHQDLDLGGIPLRIKSALKTDKINFFSKLEKCSNLGSLKAKVNTRLRSNQVGIFGALDTHSQSYENLAVKISHKLLFFKYLTNSPFFKKQI